MFEVQKDLKIHTNLKTKNKPKINKINKITNKQNILFRSELN